jgi:hypothetical protein
MKLSRIIRSLGKAKSFLLSLSLAVLPLAALTGCGGGSSNSFGGAAHLTIDASPRNVDVGDRVSIELDVEEVHSSGTIIKFRYPIELTYVNATARLLVDDDIKIFNPSTIESVDDETYLIFRLSKDEAGENNHATLTFELRAAASNDEAQISVDPDVDSTSIFNPNSPEFETEVDVTVEVE